MGNKALDKITQKKLEDIALDFIVNDKTKAEIQRDHNISKYLVDTLIKKMNLVSKKEKYRDKILEKALDRCSTYQSKIIYRATEIINGHIEKLASQQKRSESKLLMSSEIRDVMAILQITSKEYRLDHDKPTDRSIREVKVSFPEGYAPITQKQTIVDAEFKDVQKEQEIEEKLEEVEVEIDDNVLENPLG